MDNPVKPKEECGVFGISLREGPAVGIAFNGLLSLQHRGQESAGMAAAKDGAIHCRKGVGLAADVLNQNLNEFSESKTIISHCLYTVKGNRSGDNAQPFVAEYLTGRIAAAHNGKITNAQSIKDELKTKGINFNTSSDGEVIAALAAYYCRNNDDDVEGVIRTAQRLTGAYSLLFLNGDQTLMALRDPNGFRPLCVGKNESGIAFASESCALESCGFSFLRDVQPGEIIVAEQGEITYEAVRLSNKEKEYGLCLFEMVYFARPDSVIDGISVYDARNNMGRMLAKEHPIDANVVCGVPDSGLEAAIGYSAESGIPLVAGFVKNRYMGRSFIHPSQTQRVNTVRLKLNPLTAAIKDKRVVLVDDSIVRGTTTLGGQIPRMLKEAGAREVHMLISSPPFKHTCYFGTDVGEESGLIANRMSTEEIAREIGAESLNYLSLDGLKDACKACRLPFCSECFQKKL